MWDRRLVCLWKGELYFFFVFHFPHQRNVYMSELMAAWCMSVLKVRACLLIVIFASFDRYYYPWLALSFFFYIYFPQFTINVLGSLIIYLCCYGGQALVRLLSFSSLTYSLFVLSHLLFFKIISTFFFLQCSSCGISFIFIYLSVSCSQ